LLTARRRTFVVAAAIGAAVALQSPAVAQGGSLDPAFGSGGTVVTNVGAGDAAVEGIALPPDGRIVVAGYAWNGTDQDIAVARYTASGVLDPTFGSGGITLTDVNGDQNGAEAVALQPDGRIVVVGFSGGDFVAVRYTADGVLDPTFGHDGIVVSNVGGDAEADAVAIQPNGDVLAAGWSETSGQWNMVVTRYSSDGSLDKTFHKTGRVSIDFKSNDYATSILVQPDGKILVAGGSGDAGTQIAMARLRTTGGVDKTFGTNGKTTTSFPGTLASWADGAALQSDGKIVLSGFVYDGSHYRIALCRYTAAGALDGSFAGNGRVITNLGPGEDAAHAVTIQPDGDIVVAGGAGDDFGVARYTASGTLDPAFGGGAGFVTTDLGATDEAEAALLQPDGKIVAAGFSGDSSRLSFALARYAGT